MSESGRKIMVLHKDPDWGRLFKALLKPAFGDQVTFVGDGQQGLAQAEQDPPDLIFIGIDMPGLDAVEFIRCLRGVPLLARIPILVHGAMLPERAYPRVKLAGANGYLLQPFSFGALSRARAAALSGLAYYP